MGVLTTVLTLGAVYESLSLSSLVGLLTLQTDPTYSIWNDLWLEGQKRAMNVCQTSLCGFKGTVTSLPYLYQRESDSSQLTLGLTDQSLRFNFKIL